MSHPLRGLIRGLIVVPDDLGGSLHALARYLRYTRAAQLRVMSIEPDLALGFPRDLHEVPDGGQECLELIEGCQVLHAVDCDPFSFLESGDSLKKAIDTGRCTVSVQIDGTLSPAQNEELIRSSRERGWPVIATSARIAKTYALPFLPPFVPWWEGPYRPLLPGTRGREATRRPTVLQLASRRPLEAMPHLEDLADSIDDAGIENVVLDVMIGVSFPRLLQRRRWAHASLCPGEGGLSRGALEALVAGVPVISRVDRADLAVYEDLAGGEPAPVVGPETETMLAFIEGIQARQDGDASLRPWAKRVLDPERWSSYFEALWHDEARRSPAQGDSQLAAGSG